MFRKHYIHFFVLVIYVPHTPKQYPPKSLCLVQEQSADEHESIEKTTGTFLSSGIMNGHVYFTHLTCSTTQECYKIDQSQSLSNESLAWVLGQNPHFLPNETYGVIFRLHMREYVQFHESQYIRFGRNDLYGSCHSATGIYHMANVRSTC